jgi:hypothetical protein
MQHLPHPTQENVVFIDDRLLIDTTCTNQEQARQDGRRHLNAIKTSRFRKDIVRITIRIDLLINLQNAVGWQCDENCLESQVVYTGLGVVRYTAIICRLLRITP